MRQIKLWGKQTEELIDLIAKLITRCFRICPIQLSRCNGLIDHIVLLLHVAMSGEKKKENKLGKSQGSENAQSVTDTRLKLA